MTNFYVEKRQAYETHYLNVSIGDKSQIKDIQNALSSLNEIKKVNITKNSNLELTVYPKKMYSIDIVENAVSSFLKQYTPGNAADPIIDTNMISDNISDKSYSQIKEAIFSYVKYLEKTPATYKYFDEEDFRNMILPHLNSISTSTVATAETFNKNGKTDILIQNTSGDYLFIAECKLWKGESYLNSAIDQLLGRYVTFRDSKLSIIVFNKDMKNFNELVRKSETVLSLHKCFIRKEKCNDNTNQVFVFKHPIYEETEVRIALLLFNFYN